MLAGTGMIKGLITILTSYCGFDAASDFITVLTIAGDCVFYFFPFLVNILFAAHFLQNLTGQFFCIHNHSAFHKN